MTNEETRELLIEAGVPGDQIHPAALPLVSAILDAVAQRFAERLAQRVIETMTPLWNDRDAFAAKCAELGLVFGNEHDETVN